jgi:hypothetical protein
MNNDIYSLYMYMYMYLLQITSEETAGITMSIPFTENDTEFFNMMIYGFV